MQVNRGEKGLKVEWGACCSFNKQMNLIHILKCKDLTTLLVKVK